MARTFYLVFDEKGECLGLAFTYEHALEAAGEGGTVKRTSIRRWLSKYLTKDERATSALLEFFHEGDIYNLIAHYIIWQPLLKGWPPITIADETGQEEV
ncbi:MAG: hypothetical protein ACXQT2_05120 [Methanotrichaceae archaeon]